jgi:hypothetical protein
MNCELRGRWRIWGGAALGLVLVTQGCSSSPSAPGDGGSDSATKGQDSGNPGDSGKHPESGTRDSGHAADAGHDTGPHDTGADSRSAVDASDAGSSHDSGRDGGVDAGQPTTWQAFQQLLGAAFCESFIHCGSLDASRLDQCEEALRARSGTVDPVDLELRAGRVTLNSSACLAAISARACDGSLDQMVFDVCDASIVPGVPAGGVCDIYGECEDSYCTQPLGCPGGICATFAPPGGSCTTNCNPAVSFCNGSLLCQLLVTDSAACTYVTFGPDGPNGNDPCLPGAFCEITTAGATIGTCVRPTSPGALNASCDPWQTYATSKPACDAGLYCAPAVSESVLPVCALKIAEGRQCPTEDMPWTNGFPSASGSPCVDGNACYFPVGGPPGILTCQPLVPESGACVVADNHCQLTLDCVPTVAGLGTCQPMPFDGQPCTASAPACGTIFGSQDQCVILGDGATTGQCREALSWGDPCDPSLDNSGAGGCASVGVCESAQANAPKTCTTVCP